MILLFPISLAKFSVHMGVCAHTHKYTYTHTVVLTQSSVDFFTVPRPHKVINSMTLCSPDLVIQSLTSNWNLMKICEGKKQRDLKKKKKKKLTQAIEFEKKI